MRTATWSSVGELSTFSSSAFGESVLLGGGVGIGDWRYVNGKGIAERRRRRGWALLSFGFVEDDRPLPLVGSRGRPAPVRVSEITLTETGYNF